MTAILEPASVHTPLWYGLDEVPADLGPTVVTIGVCRGLPRADGGGGGGHTVSDLERRVARLEGLEAIRDLDARYCRALDDGDWDTLVSLFTEDGEFVGLSRARGHAALRTFFAGLADAGPTTYWHHVTNLEISLEGDVAHARSFLWQPCVQDGEPHIAAGRYTDTLRRVEGAWRYVTKQVSFDYFVPLRDGWDHGRSTVASAAATYPGRTS